jgi:hypothetical protein
MTFLLLLLVKVGAARFGIYGQNSKGLFGESK